MAIWKLKDGKGFRGEVTLGVNVDGKPIRKYIQRKRKSEVEDEIRRLTRKLELNQTINGKTLTVGRFMNEWLEDYVKPNRSHATYRGYEQTNRMYIVPLLGNVPLDDLSGQDVQKFLNKLAKLSAEERFTDKHKNLSRKKSRANQLTPASVKRVHATLKSAMTRAVKWGRLAINPAKNAESPKQRKYIPTPLTMTQAAALLKAVEGDRLDGRLYLCCSWIAAWRDSRAEVD